MLFFVYNFKNEKQYPNLLEALPNQLKSFTESIQILNIKLMLKFIYINI